MSKEQEVNFALKGYSVKRLQVYLNLNMKNNLIKQTFIKPKILFVFWIVIASLALGWLFMI